VRRCALTARMYGRALTARMQERALTARMQERALTARMQERAEKSVQGAIGGAFELKL